MCYSQCITVVCTVCTTNVVATDTRQGKNILMDSSHGLHDEYKLIHSGERYRLPLCKTNWYQHSFVPLWVKLINEQTFCNFAQLRMSLCFLHIVLVIGCFHCDCTGFCTVTAFVVFHCVVLLLFCGCVFLFIVYAAVPLHPNQGRQLMNLDLTWLVELRYRA